MKQIATALSTAHSYGIIHKHLQPRNVLVHKKSDSVKLGFFGFEKFAENDNEYFFVAPEVLDEKEYRSPKSDIFSFGVLVLSLATLKDYDVKYKADDYFDDIQIEIEKVIRIRPSYYILGPRLPRFISPPPFPPSLSFHARITILLYMILQKNA